MNANDVICVGAKPFSMVDYIAVQHANPEFLGEIAKGLWAGAERADITIPGGEIAQSARVKSAGIAVRAKLFFASR